MKCKRWSQLCYLNSLASKLSNQKLHFMTIKAASVWGYTATSSTPHVGLGQAWLVPVWETTGSRLSTDQVWFANHFSIEPQICSKCIHQCDRISPKAIISNHHTSRKWRLSAEFSFILIFWWLDSSLTASLLQIRIFLILFYINRSKMKVAPPPPKKQTNKTAINFYGFIHF